MSELNLYQRIVAVMVDMGAIGKKGKTSYGEQYEYHRIDDVDDKLRKALIAHGVVALPIVIDHCTLEHFEATDKHGKPRTTWNAECVIDIMLINVDKPEENAIIQGWGQGIDYGDKATGKAISYAAKAAYLSAFHLRGQPDNEADDIPRNIPKLSAEDMQFVAEALKEIKAADSLEILGSYGQVLKEKSPAIRNALRPAYDKRQRMLKEVEDSEINSELPD